MLELGCGGGHLATAMMEAIGAETLKYTGIDVTADCIAVAKEKRALS